MIHPNFSESQLQELVNIEIERCLYDTHRRLYPPIIPSLREGYVLGWDTGSYFPWLWHHRFNLERHRGCNFFLQYKLSSLFEGLPGKEYSFWNRPYLKFLISYSTKDRLTGRYGYDHNQFDNLKKLANQGYPVYYATNQAIYLEDLQRLADSNALLNDIPFLDVSNITDRHNKVTFTQNSEYFLLHSKAIKVPVTRWEQVYNTAKNKGGSTFSEDVKSLGDFILAIEKHFNMSGKGGFASAIQKTNELDWPKQIRIIAKAMVVAKYLRKYLGLHWHKIWLNYT